MHTVSREISTKNPTSGENRKKKANTADNPWLLTQAVSSLICIWRNLYFLLLIIIDYLFFNRFVVVVYPQNDKSGKGSKSSSHSLPAPATGVWSSPLFPTAPVTGVSTFPLSPTAPVKGVSTSPLSPLALATGVSTSPLSPLQPQLQE